MKKIAIILALMLILGTVVISGCTVQKKNNTTGKGSNQSKSPTGYDIGQILSDKTGNGVSTTELNAGSDTSRGHK